MQLFLSARRARGDGMIVNYLLEGTVRNYLTTKYGQENSSPFKGEEVCQEGCKEGRQEA